VSNFGRSFGRSHRARSYIFLALTLLIGGVGIVIALSSCSSESSEESSQSESEEPAQLVPSDPTLYLTVPKLGIYDHTIKNDMSEETLSLGAGKFPDTGFPWEEGDVNTYIGCHRLGYPNTESYLQCLDLPQMQEGDEIILKDTNGTVYNYQASEFLQVEPSEMWVTESVEGRNIVSLQTCIEDYNDFSTLGPNWSVRYIVRADQVS
jgi:sortase A